MKKVVERMEETSTYMYCIQIYIYIYIHSFYTYCWANMMTDLRRASAYDAPVLLLADKKKKIKKLTSLSAEERKHGTKQTKQRDLGEKEKGKG